MVLRLLDQTRMLGWKFCRNWSFLLRLTFSSSLILSSVKLLTFTCVALVMSDTMNILNC